MEIQWGKMILHGLLNAVFYIGLPLGIIYIFEYLNVITFAESFTTSILIFGIIGTFISMLKHAFPKDTSANRLVSFFISVYSGVYLFFIFGGFEPSTKLGTYSIDMSLIKIFLGLQIIAWLLLASTIIRALQFLIEAIELRKGKEYNIRMKKQFKLSKLFKAAGFLMSLIIMGYFASIIYSGMNLNFNIHEIQPTDIDHDPAGTPTDYSDDTMNITLYFDITNNGVYAIYNVNLSLVLFLSNGTILGEAPNRYYSAFHSFTQTLNQNLTIIINPNYIGFLALNSDTLRLQISFETLYAAIYIDLDLSLLVPWAGP